MKVVKKYIRKDGRYILENNKRVFESSESREIKGLTKESIEFIGDNNLMLVHNVPNLKRSQNVPRRTIPIYIPKVRDFYEMFIKHYNTLSPGSALFDITRQRAWQIIKEESNLFNHFFIHERTTHLVANEGFTDLDLMHYRGWSSTMPARFYTHLNWQALARKQGADVDD
jgi:hypothetical protein